MRRYLVHSNYFYQNNTPNKIKGSLSISYHIIEKGLTMPETRLGFGKENVRTLIDLCKLYVYKNFDIDCLELIHSINILGEYLTFHKRNGFEIDSDIVVNTEYLNSIVKGYPTPHQLDYSRDDFFKNSESKFDNFCYSRHSVRNFTSDDIPLSLLYNCIDLAIQSPSACNRQPTRVHLIKNKELKNKILEIQSGNRGFGHLSNALFVITSDISFFQGLNERNESYLNAGMFSMTLIYALHFFNIGSCSLNWSTSNLKDKTLRNLINIPDNESINLIIACGYIPDKLKIAASPRASSLSITKEYL